MQSRENADLLIANLSHQLQLKAGDQTVEGEVSEVAEEEVEAAPAHEHKAPEAPEQENDKPEEPIPEKQEKRRYWWPW